MVASFVAARTHWEMHRARYWIHHKVVAARTQHHQNGPAEGKAITHPGQHNCM